MSAVPRPVVLVVDDEEVIRGTFVELLSEKYDTLHATGLADARAILASSTVDVIVLDWLYEDGSTAEPLLAELASKDDSPAVVIASVSKAAFEAATKYGVPALLKPFDLDALMHSVAEAKQRLSRPMLPKPSSR